VSDSGSPGTDNDAGVEAAAGADSDTVGCHTDSRAQTYSANLQRPGMSKHFDFVLMSATPGPPAKGINSWVLKIVDAQGNAVPNVAITSVVPYMPDHGHGTSVAPQWTSNADGSFTIHQLVLFMPGLWQVTINVASGAMTNCTTDASQCDSVVYSFCVAG
jgi:hypothetical protein